MTDLHITSITMTIPAGMMPKGNWWDAGGASFQAWADDSARGWHWHPGNTKARQQGEPIGELVSYYPIVGGLP